MSMALKSDVAMACRASGLDKPVDLVHLSSLTMGDRKLESEILGMFAAQIPQFHGMIESASGIEDVKRAAHTIKGAAQSIGAFRLAEIAKDGESTGKIKLDAFNAEMDSIRNYIEQLS